MDQAVLTTAVVAPEATAAGVAVLLAVVTVLAEVAVAGWAVRAVLVAAVTASVGAPARLASCSRLSAKSRSWCDARVSAASEPLAE